MTAGPDPLFGAPPGQEEALYVVTNRFNLLEILSSGLISPIQGYTKWYQDLLGLSEGRIPLIRGPVGDDICSAVGAESPTAFPVALEIDVASLGAAEVPALTEVGVLRTPPAGACKALAPSGAIPVAAIRAIHFRSGSELGEHEARSYENIPATGPFCVISPSVFGSGGTGLEELSGFLHGLDPVGGDLGRALRAADRRGGAITMLAASAPPYPDEIKAVGGILGGKRPRKGVPGWLADALLGTSPKRPPADHVLFSAALDVLSDQDQTLAWRPNEILDLIEARIRESAGATVAREVVRNTGPIRAILRNDRPRRRFAPGTGLSSAKALLLVLLRPEPAALLGWGRHDTGADAEIEMAAAALCGALHGRSRLPANLRPAGLDQFLARSAASEVSARTPDPSAPPPPKAPRYRDRVEADGTTVLTLMGSKGELVSWSKPLPTLVELIGRASTDPAGSPGLLEDIIQTMGWTDCRVTTVRGGEIEKTGPVGAAEIRVLGWPEIRVELDVQTIQRRAGSGGLTPELEARVRSELDRP